MKPRRVQHPHHQTGRCHCGAVGQLWGGRCDGCLERHENQRARELPPGEERKPLAWASWETRPITAAEASHRVRAWGPGNAGNADVDSYIRSRLSLHDSTVAGHKLTKDRDWHETEHLRSRKKPDAPLGRKP